MKSIITVLLSATVIILGTGCSSPCDTDPRYYCLPIGGKFFEGWAGPPEDTKKKPLEYYYMIRASKISPIIKGAPATWKETCTQTNVLTAKADYIRRTIGETLTGAEGVEDGESTGKLIGLELRGKIEDLKARECRPLAAVKPDAPGSEWEECECIIYARVPGGKDAIIARAVEIERNREK